MIPNSERGLRKQTVRPNKKQRLTHVKAEHVHQLQCRQWQPRPHHHLLLLHHNQRYYFFRRSIEEEVRVCLRFESLDEAEGCLHLHFAQYRWWQKVENKMFVGHGPM